MKRIALLSDTHAHLDPELFKWFDGADEIWHAGDIGNIQTADTLSGIKPLKAVYGNIDGHEIRSFLPQDLIFTCEDVKVWMTHIGGYPGKYSSRIRSSLEEIKPGIFICGHSHILKVIYDHKYKLLFMNPGAAGNSGFHLKRTMLRFSISGREIHDLEAIELGNR